MVDHLSREWLELRVAASADVEVAGGADLTVRVVVTGKPADVAWLERWEAGRLVSAHLLDAVSDIGDDDVDLDVTIKRTDAVAIHRGDMDEAAAFMSGRWKAEGAIGHLLAWQRSLQSPQWRAARERVAAQTG